MTRDEQKKMLIVEGMMHRLEIAHSLHQVRDTVSANNILSKWPSLLKFIASRSARPLLAGAIPLVLGKGKLSRLVRRALLIAGAGVAVTALVKRFRAAKQPV